MTELDLLRLQVAGMPVHVHKSPKRGEWGCTSPYCTSLLDESPRPGPGEPEEVTAAHDRGDIA